MANPNAAAAGGAAPNPLSMAPPPDPSAIQNQSTTDIAKTIGGQNLQTGAARNQLIPSFAQNMFSAGGPSMDFFKQLMDPNSPFAKFMQRSTWEQGVKQSSDAGAQARQGIRASGYGYTPSGVEAASMGNMSRGMSSDLITNFMSNLFQMPVEGAKGLMQLMQLFNPAQLTGQQTQTGNMQQTPTFMQNLNATLGTLFGTSGARGISGGG